MWWLILILVLVVWFLIVSNQQTHKEKEEIKHAKQSQSVVYGKSIEQFMPFMKDYPYEQKNFRFLGTPIDGVQFNEDDIVFIEFKGANSKLTPRQKNIKNLVESGHIRWEEIRI